MSKQSALSFCTQKDRPLADILRPDSLERVVGQDKLLAEGGRISLLLQSNHLPSFIFWGPPGCGKTTLARIIAQKVELVFDEVSAISSGVPQLKKHFEVAEKHWLETGKSTVLFVDEIHHFNRAQQDIFLPVIEKGIIILIGATTQNPSFELNPALLSRCTVIVLSRLESDSLSALITRAEEYMKRSLPLDDDAKLFLTELADGDGRYLLNLCESLFTLPQETILDKKGLLLFCDKRKPIYDKKQDGHYNLISALHKSLRGSDVDAALYWLNRMMEAGEEPLYIIRRLIRFAVEDIGLADPQALIQATATKDAYQFLGSPEGDLSIAQLVIYLATAPKSNAVYKAFKQSRNDAKKYGSLMPPKNILNAPTELMKDEGYGDGYIYEHDTKEGVSSQRFFPDMMEPVQYYVPFERGFEREINKRLRYFKKIRSGESA